MNRLRSICVVPALWLIPRLAGAELILDPGHPALIGAILERLRSLLTILSRKSFMTVTLSVGLAAASFPSSARAAPRDWAFVLADQPTTASYASTEAMNSAGGAITITRSGVGVYRARLPNLGAIAGVVHVTASGDGSETCKVTGWGPSGSDQSVGVRCFDASGAAADSAFTLSYANPITPDSYMAYLWADQATAASYTPAGAWQFNTTGSPNTVTRQGVGTYTASLPAVLPGFFGHAQVTAYGTGSERCKVESWGPSASSIAVRVRCFTNGGAPVDTRYTLTFVDGCSLVGGNAQLGAPGPSGSYVWADRPTTGSYTPRPAYQWDAYGETITVDRLGVGSYAVSSDTISHDDSLGMGIQVTAYGSGAEHCKVASWNWLTGVSVHCFDSSGAPADARFDMAHLDRWGGL